MVRLQLPCVRSRSYALIVGALLLCGVALADQVLDICTDSLISYLPTGKTKVNDCRPRAEQRGVGIDGTLRSPAAQPFALAGNPSEAVWGGTSVLDGVRLDSGTWSPTDVDLALAAPGFRWVVGRTYNARQEESSTYQDSNGPQGKNWFQSSQPELHYYDHSTDDSKDTIYLVYGADRYAEFRRKDANSSEFKARNGAAGKFILSGSNPKIWTYRDSLGNEFKFFGDDTASNRADWQLWKVTDPLGNVAYVGDKDSASAAVTSGFDNSGRITTAYSSSDVRYTYTYSSTSWGGATRLTQVKAETKSGSSWSSPGTVTEVGRVDYGYYEADSESYGEAGDLKLVTITIPGSDSNGTKVLKTHYRYWEGSYDSSTNPGYLHALKLVVEPEGCRKFDWSETGTGEPTLDDGFLTASHDDLKPYASAYFEYDTNHRVKKAWFQGQCSCSGSANGLHEFAYSTSAGSFTSSYDNGWARRTVVKRPDDSHLTQYFDEVGQPMSEVVTDRDPTTTSPVPIKRVTSVTRDSIGCVDQVATPASVTAYTHDYQGNPSGAITLDSGVGLIKTYVRESTGDATGFVLDQKYKTGTGGSLYFERTQTWNVADAEETSGDVRITRPLLASTKVYPDKDVPTTFYTTSYAYATWSGLPLTLETATVTYPAVSTGNNGSGSSDVSRVHYKKDGTIDFEKSAGGTVTYREYGNGLVTKLIRDADTTKNASGEDFYQITIPTNFSSASGVHAHHKTVLTYGNGGLETQTLPNSRVLKYYYSKLLDGRLVRLGYTNYTSASGGTYFGPIQYTVTNLAGRPEAEGVIGVATTGSTYSQGNHIDESSADVIAAVGSSASFDGVKQLTTYVYDKPGVQLGEMRSYFLIPSSGTGSDSNNYDPTICGYDDMGRLRRVVEPHGTITRTKYDFLGRPYETWVGTNDSSFPGGTSGTDNTVMTGSLAYDDGSVYIGNSNVATRKLRVESTSSGERTIGYEYDVRGNVLRVDNAADPDVLNKYDNQNRLIAYGLFSGTSSWSDPTATTSSGRRALSQASYDERGRAWKTQREKIDASDGSDDDNVQTLRWFDADGHLIMVDGEAELAKTFYDRLGQQTHHFTLASYNESPTTWSAAADVDGDIVLDERQTTYATNSSNVLMEATISRYQSDLSTPTGKLDTNADGDAMKYTIAGSTPDVKGRIQISAMWYDSNTDRVTDQVEYGTNTGSDFDRAASGLANPPTSSTDTALLTHYTYNTDGTLKEVSDPKAIKTQFEYDAAGRTTKVISNYDNGTPGGTNGDEDQTVAYAYTDGLMTTLTAKMPSSSDDQVTTYTWGVTKGTSAGDSKIARNDLLKKVQYPESTDATDDVAKYAYSVQGEIFWKKDQVNGGTGGNIIETDYDLAGRKTVRRVQTVGTGSDDAVRRIETAYSSWGEVETVSQFGATAGGSAIDQVKYTYDGWGNVEKFEQDPDSTVGASGGVPTKEVSYTYAKSTTGRNTVRRTHVTLPGSKTFEYKYRRTNGLPDDDASRVSRILDGTTVLLNYDYLGVGTVVGTMYDEPDVMSKLYDLATPTTYPDLDFVNRVVKSRWTKDLGTDVDFYHTELSYDRNSNIASADEVGVHAKADFLYTTDNLNRLTRAQEGKIVSSSIGSSDERTDQSWTLTQTGNWSNVNFDLNADNSYGGSGEYNDTRTHDKVNQLNARNMDSSGGNEYSLVYDAPGNMTDDGKDYEYVWDAFGRLRKVFRRAQDPAVLVAEFRYNGLGYRLAVHEDTEPDGDVDSNDPWYYLVYDEDWQMIATYRGTDTTPYERFVHHQAGVDGLGSSSYIDAVAFRERDTDFDGTLEERLYYCQNQHADIVALITAGGAQREQARSSPYGIPFGFPVGDADSDGDCDSADVTQVNTWRTTTPTPIYDVRGDVDLDGDVDAADETAVSGFTGVTLGRGALSAAPVGNRRGDAGYEIDPKLAGTKYHIRYRVLDSSLGRWSARDAVTNADTANLYEYSESQPLTYIDAFGLQSQALNMGGSEAHFSNNLGQGGPAEAATCGVLAGGGGAAILELLAGPVGWCALGATVVVGGATIVAEAREHRKNKQGKNWDDHSKKRPDGPEKKDERMDGRSMKPTEPPPPPKSSDDWFKKKPKPPSKLPSGISMSGE
jgi:RHS repeat-associated protein